ncbi:hypothetical protein FCL53_10740 [Elizabethkingia meningoseptica]|uniref:hypothetical protein n=1 Tax=Elizabethkingia meningoseptica TaxID=238 RepID=UPI001365B620|nr:hypothetical protein [Elizabethkingia meningoseptica]MVW92441.1 hypothetical protein [Elizabethkingia meningoseptica]
MDSLSNRIKSSFKEEKSMVQIFEELNKEIKMDKLKLNDIAPYLPHKMSVQILNHRNDYTGIEFSEVNGYYFIGESLHITYNGGNTGKSISEFKPIIRPMSDLTKEITHNGETFVPSDILFGGLRPIEAKERHIQDLIKHPMLMPYCYVQKFFEWHFDVFGLIERGLAINLNEVDNGK